MTLRTTLGFTRKPKELHCVVCWPQEDNRLSVVSSKKVVSPSLEDLCPGTFCSIKGFESHMCKIVAVGSKSEMEEKVKQWDEEEKNQEEADARPPPKKKQRKEKATTANKGNKTPSRKVKKAAKKKGNIILVGASTTEQSTALSALDTNLPPAQKSPQEQQQSVPTQQQSVAPPILTQQQSVASPIPTQQQKEQRDITADPVRSPHTEGVACALSTPGLENFDDSFSSFSSPEEQNNGNPGKHHHNLSQMAIQCTCQH